MEKCRYCQAELAENGTFCPVCGRNNAEEEVAEVSAEAVTGEETMVEEAAPQAQEAPAKKVSSGKIAAMVAAVVVLAAVLAGLVFLGRKDPNEVPAETAAAEATQETVAATVPADGNPEDVTCKGSYTVSDEEAVAGMNTVVAKIGDKTLTNGQLQVYYRGALNSYLSSEYGYYVVMYGGMDYTQPLDTQICAEDEDLTWQQYFVRYALNNWQLAQALAAKAEERGLEMDAEYAEYLQSMEQTLTATAESYELTLDEMMLQEFGAGVGLEEFRSFEELYYAGLPYYQEEVSKLVPTQEDLEAFFAEHQADYEAGGLTKDSKFVDVRHILLMPEGGTTSETGATTYSEEEWAACEAAAREVLDTWLAGDKTEDSFAALANEKSVDGGSNQNGGLYSQVYEGQMVQAFNDWCFDESRAYGDYDLVKTEYGYHVMFFVSSEPQWMYYAESDWISEQTNLFVTELAAGFPMEVEFDKITLGYASLGG